MQNKPNLEKTDIVESRSFYGLGIAPKLLQVLERIKFKTPTPIQFKAIPPAIDGKDVMGIAQTGTGKTHSFAIPMVQRLAIKDGIGIVLAPTRELAIQIEEAFQPLVQAFGMRTACLIGGASMQEQLKALRRKPRVIIATPGRLTDHMSNWNVMTHEVNMLVLDEADRMLDMGFAPQIDRILKYLPHERQTMLFSATMPAEIMSMTSKYMKLPVSVEVAPSGTTVENVTQELFIVKKDMKLKLLSKLIPKYHGAILLFSRTKHNARRITHDLNCMGHKVAQIHSDRSLAQRREALEGFKSGRYKILVATDIAARGIDVTGIELVVNFDLPEDAENYVHRIGRTARAGHKGHAVSFATPDQSKDVNNIEKLIKVVLPIARHPEIPSEKFAVFHKNSRPNTAKGQRRHHGHRHRGFNKSRRNRHR